MGGWGVGATGEGLPAGPSDLPGGRAQGGEGHTAAEPRGKRPAPGPRGGTPRPQQQAVRRQNGRPKPDPGHSAQLESYHGEDGGGFTRASRSTGTGVRGRGAPAALDLLPPCQEPLPLCLLPRWRPRATSPTGNGAGQRAEGGAPWGGECAGTRLPDRFSPRRHGGSLYSRGTYCFCPFTDCQHLRLISDTSYSL